MKKTLTILFLAITIFAKAEDGIAFSHDITFQQAIDKARAEGKLIFMDCYTTWCGPCKRLSAQTFPDKAVGEFFNDKFVSVKFDMEKGEGPEISARFGVKAYPTLLWINPESINVKHRAMGYMEPAGLIEQAKKAVDPTPGILAGMIEKYKAGNRDMNFLNDYINTLNNAGGNSDSLLIQFIGGLKGNDSKNEKYNNTIFSATNNLLSPGVAYVLQNKSNFIAKMGADAFASKTNAIADKAISEAVIKKDEAIFNQAVKFLKDAGNKDAEEKIANANMDYSLRTQDLKLFDKYASQYIKKFAQNNEKKLNDIAWNYYINVTDYKQLEKAKKWSYKAVNLKNTCENNTTYAYLNYKLGNTKEADLACDYALIKAKEEGGSDLSAKALKALLKAEQEKK